jgi:hypothetical protein
VSNDYISDRYCFGIRCPQRTPNLMTLSQLEIANRPYTIILSKYVLQCSFGHVGRSRQFSNPNGFAVALIEQLRATANDFLSRKPWSPLWIWLAGLSPADNCRRDFQ